MIAHDLPARGGDGLHPRFAERALLDRHAPVHLTLIRRADVVPECPAARARMRELIQGVCPCGDDLRLQRGRGPRPRHLGQALQVLVEGDVIDQRKAAIRAPDDLEPSPVARAKVLHALRLAGHS